MKNSILRAAAALSLVAVALMAPTAAHAYPDPAVVIATPATIAPNNTSTFTTDRAPFNASEDIRITITGENANGARLAFIKTAIETNTMLTTRAVQGKLNVPTLSPQNASGKYDLTFTGVTSGVVLRTRITVTPSGTTTTPSKAGLAVTGFNSDSAAGLWIAGGALVVAGAAVGVGAAVRRRRTAA